MNSLTREDILGMEDIKVKKITNVPVWNKTVYIRQLTRGEQDMFMKRRFQEAQMVDGKFTSMDLYGHDAFLCVCAVSDKHGKRLFENTPEEIKNLDEKNGEAVGFLATEIVLWSGMRQDVEDLKEVKN